MLGLRTTSKKILLGRSVSTEVTSLDRRSAQKFFALGIHWISKLMKTEAKSFTFYTYFFMFSSQAVKSLLMYPTTNYESLQAFNCFAPSSFAILSPIARVSYLTSLLVAENSKIGHTWQQLPLD